MAETEGRPEAEVIGTTSVSDTERVQSPSSTEMGRRQTVPEKSQRTGEMKKSPEEEARKSGTEEGKEKEEKSPTRRESQAQRPQTQNQQQGATDTQTDRKADSSPDHISDSFSSQRVYKKSSPNNKLTLYLASRDLIVSESKIDKLLGVLLIDPDFVQDKRVYGQVTLTFRYGREDEEVMGLKFCNEAVMCLAQLYPPFSGADHQEATTPLQEALVKRLGPNAHAFTMEITALAPPSVQLVPAKEYNGAPIGTSYDVRAYVADRSDERLHRKTTVRMGIRVIQRTSKPPQPTTTVYTVPTPTGGSRMHAFRTRVTFAENEILKDDENTGPRAAVEKPFLLSDGRVGLEARLDRAIYAHGDTITVHVSVNNNSSKSVRRIKVFVVQHVDVCMFSNGKFKNVVALVSSQDGCPVGPGTSLKTSYTLRPIKGSTKNWIALEDSYTKTGATLASTVVCPGNGLDDRNVFAIYVSYYVKVKLLVSAMGGVVSLKLPFTLMHSNNDPDLVGFPSPIRDPVRTTTTATTTITTTTTTTTTTTIADKATDTMVEVSKRQENNGQRKTRESKSEVTKESRESRITDVDLIEHYDEGDST